MHQNNRWRTVIQYTAGIVIVALCTAAAMFLPQQYAQWSDGQTTGKVTLSKRDTIEFLNIEKLDIEKRLEMLQEADEFYFSDGTIDAVTYFNLDAEEFIATCKRLIGGWCEAGLLPESCETILDTVKREMEDSPYWIDLYHVWWYGSFEDYAEQGMLPILVVTITDGVDTLAFAMDPEVEVLYWAALNGDLAVQEIAKELGYSSAEELDRYIQGDGELKDPVIAPREIDFAAAFGAKSAQVEEDPELFEMTAKLTFDTFEAEAMRCLFLDDFAVPGIAAMYGTDRGKEFIEQLFSMQGRVAIWISTEELLEMINHEGMEEKAPEAQYN